MDDGTSVGSSEIEVHVPELAKDGFDGRIRIKGLTPSQVSLLDDPIRQKIAGLLRRMPGLNKSQIRRFLGVWRNTVEHHTRRLVEGGIVVLRESAQKNEELCFLAVDASLWEEETTRILFGRAPNRRVALFVAEHPGSLTVHISEALGLEDVTILHHLRTLRKHGLVKEVRKGNRVEYFARQPLLDWLDRAGGGFVRPWESHWRPFE